MTKFIISEIYFLQDGCFSSDSDAFLFGARTVYRDIYLGQWPSSLLDSIYVIRFMGSVHMKFI